MPATVAGTMPRSVMMPVMSSAGVTSNAGLSAGVRSGATRTLASIPAASTPSTVREATALSDLHLNAARTRSVARVVVRNPGRFIGRAGANIRDLRRTTDTLIYSRGEREGNVFVVYYRTPEGLAAVRRRAAA